MSTNPEYKTLLYQVENGVARITLNRPDAANALNRQMFQDIYYTSLQCSEDPAVRAVLISNTGKVFCAGGDLKEFAKEENLPKHLKNMTTYLHAAVSRLTRMDAPVLAVVNGSAAGAGMSLVCACDIVFAAESARFVMAYTAAGLTPDGSSTYFLPRIVGFKRALELTLTNRTLSAQEALEWGIVTRVLPNVHVLNEAIKLAEQLAAGPTKAFGTAKRLLHSGWHETLETQMENEAQEIANMTRTEDGLEGINAFLNKRKPKFKGK